MGFSLIGISFGKFDKLVRRSSIRVYRNIEGHTGRLRRRSEQNPTRITGVAHRMRRVAFGVL